MPDNQAPISLYKFVGVLSETTPQPLSVELKVSIIAISDIEKNNSRIDRIFFIIPTTTKFSSISWSFFFGLEVIQAVLHPSLTLLQEP